MSDSEDEENFCYFGKPLEPYDEDAFPKKKPISVEDQIATDAQGRRRFHGAFTGGFSAGFFNTVGSLEGWTPSEFKSTRSDKAQSKMQKPEDFMDDEDMGEFGIAPQTVRATSDYSTSKKRKKQVFSDGPIPGEPVLHSLLTSGNETIGYLLLRNIGLKNRPNLQDEAPTNEEKVYGCEMPKTYEISRDADADQYVIPDIYREFLKKPKDNTFGLGYEGLDKSHVNLFQSAKLVIRDRNKKKVSISGQAFGVGAFEDDDEDIYVKDDMSKYDFELTSEKSSRKDLSKKEKMVFDDFVASKKPLPPKEIFPPPTIPHSFTGKHKVKRSRFEPLPEPETPERKDMNPEIRARYLGEEVAPPPQTEPVQIAEKIKVEKPDPPPSGHLDLFPSSGGRVFDRFVSASKPEDPSNILETVERSETEHGTQEMRDAARMKMFGPLTRISVDWQPCALLCKRFNVPEPHCELSEPRNRKRTKNLIFEYEKFADISADFKPGLSTTSEEKAEERREENVENEKKEEGAAIEVKEDEKAVVDVPKDITEKIDVDKNMDLFKAVFLSSSESEGEEENEKEKSEKSTEMKNSVLSDSLLPRIKPIKEGILSNMDFTIFQANDGGKEKGGESASDVSQKSEFSYGPALPARLPTTTSATSTLPYKDDDNDEWVEKSDDDKKNKQKKKHKKEHKKSSHKKKHKHKDR